MLCAFVAYASVGNAYAQPNDRLLQFDHFSMADGLSIYSVTALLQDRQGFLWIGTVDGLNRYDGYQFKVFRHDSRDTTSLSTDYIDVGALAEDEYGYIWVGTRYGLNKLDPATGKVERFFLSEDGALALNDNFVLGVLPDHAGRLWIGTHEGLIEFDLKSHKITRHPTLANGDPLGSIMSLAMDDNGQIWMGGEKGLHIFDIQSGQIDPWPISVSEDALFLIVTKVLAGNEGVIWAGLLDGSVLRIDPDTGLMRRFDLLRSARKPNVATYVLDLYLAEDGRLWSALWEHGLVILNPETDEIQHIQEDFQNPYAFKSELVSAFLKDRSGLFWVGTWDGLSRVRPRQRFQNMGPNSETIKINYPRARSIIIGQTGDIWIGTQGGGVNKINMDGTIVSYINDPDNINSLSYDMVTSVIEDDSGLIWIATGGGGVNRLNPETNQFDRFYHNPDAPNSLSSNYVYKIFEDSKGRIWIGTTSGGLNRYDERSNQFYRYKHDADDSTSISGNEVWTIFEDSKKQLWVGTIAAGLNKIVEKVNGDSTLISFDRFRHDPDDPHSIPSNNVVFLSEDDMGRLWVGTMGGGLSRFHPETNYFENWSMDDGLPSDNVGCVLPGEEKYWLSTSNGLVRFDPEEGILSHYTEADGLINTVFYFDGCTRSDDGTLYFAGDQGVTVFNEVDIIDNLTPAATVITDFRVSDRPATGDSLASARKHWSFPHDSNSVAISFSALDFTIPAHNDYRYRMEGVNSDWVTDYGSRQANYSNLSPGIYKFEVEGTNNSGVKSVNPAVLYIEIRPAYWQTLWFWSLVGVIGALGVWGSFLVRSRHRSEVEETRQQIADDLHDDFGGNLSAFSFFLGRLSSNKNLTDDDVGRIKVYRTTIERMLEDLHDVIWLTDPEYDDLNGLAERMVLTAQNLMQHRPFHFESHGISDDIKLSLKLRRHLFLVYKEALHNVVRHAEATQVQLVLTFEDGMLRVLVKDNGKGFDGELKKHRQGLKAMHRRAEQGRFALVITSALGAGTSVEIKARIA